MSTAPDEALTESLPCQIHLIPGVPCAYDAAWRLRASCAGCGQIATWFTCRTCRLHLQAGKITCQKCGGRMNLIAVL